MPVTRGVTPRCRAPRSPRPVPSRRAADPHRAQVTPRTVVLFGDSHAAQWFPALRRLATVRGWKLVSLTKASCKVADVTILNDHGPYTVCDTWRSRAVAKIDALRPELVVVSSSDAGDPARPAADPLQQWTTGFEDTFRDLGTSGAHVAVLLDTPWPKGDPVDCAAKNSLHLRACANHLPDATYDATRHTAVRGAAAATGASVIDPGSWVCAPRTGICPVVVGDTAVHRDESHLSEAYAEALTPVLAPALDRLLGTD
ncbi:SGNH hydrolase domain-containing protein [Streptomyces sp. NPDC018964]|uniref:SGNH hydrolase domain-containing protein n=1 Tax=Streptomyces sp. NPDC018964 TaxID=3365058 RepID=UPI0037ACC1E1